MAEGPGAGAVAGALLEAGTVTFSIDAPVTFKSGLRSPVYVDNRRLISQPGPWRVVIDAFRARLGTGAAAPEVIAGVESAGIPHSSALAYAASLPSVFVRKAAKEHGLGRRIEGGDVDGRRVVLVEDMVTTGGSSLSAVAALREGGASVSRCLAIITYGFSEATAAFDEAAVVLETLTTFDEVLEAGRASGRVDAETEGSVRTWLEDPWAWVPA